MYRIENRQFMKPLQEIERPRNEENGKRRNSAILKFSPCKTNMEKRKIFQENDNTKHKTSWFHEKEQANTGKEENKKNGKMVHHPQKKNMITAMFVFSVMHCWQTQVLKIFRFLILILMNAVIDFYANNSRVKV